MKQVFASNLKSLDLFEISWEWDWWLNEFLHLLWAVAVARERWDMTWIIMFSLLVARHLEDNDQGLSIRSMLTISWHFVHQYKRQDEMYKCCWSQVIYVWGTPQCQWSVWWVVLYLNMILCWRSLHETEAVSRVITVIGSFTEGSALRWKTW